MLRRISTASQTIEQAAARSWVVDMLQSFEEKDELYTFAESINSSKESVSQISLTDSSRQSLVNSRFERLQFMKKLLIGSPQLVGYRRAWDMYRDIREGGHGYVEKLFGKGMVAPDFEDMNEFKGVHRAAVSIIKREEERAKAPKRRKAATENEGYSEPVIEPVIEQWRFQPETVLKSLVEDKWKADHYVMMCFKIREAMQKKGGSALDSDDLESVLRRASEKFLRDECRPVLTNELADYYNPYMMKKSATERLLHEKCVRNKLEESLVEEFLANDSRLIKLRSEAELPPELIEPVQAFRGITDWSMDPEIRMVQKLNRVKTLLDLIDSSPEQLPRQEQVTSPVFLCNGKIKHDFKNHLGFKSEVPTGRLGGWAHGKSSSSEADIGGCVRYPTLQRVAHSFPKDPHYRSQAMHAIRVLEQSRGWAFSDKTRAVNALKEVLEALPSSAMLVGKLDKALPVSRFDRRLKGVQFIRRKPSNLKRRNRIRMYFRSVTASVPLSRRWADRRAKNQARAKKKDK